MGEMMNTLQECLAELMQKLSKKYTDDFWYADLETQLWNRLHFPDAPNVFNKISDDELEALRVLSNLLKGWIFWAGPLTGPSFISFTNPNFERFVGPLPLKKFEVWLEPSRGGAGEGCETFLGFYKAKTFREAVEASLTRRRWELKYYNPTNLTYHGLQFHEADPSK